MGLEGEGGSQASRALTNHDFPPQGPWLRALGPSQTPVRTPHVSPPPVIPVSLGRVALVVAPVSPVSPVVPVTPVALVASVVVLADPVVPAAVPVALVVVPAAPVVVPAAPAVPVAPVGPKVVLRGHCCFSQGQAIPTAATPLGLAPVCMVLPAPPSRGLAQLYQAVVALPTS